MHTCVGRAALLSIYVAGVTCDILTLCHPYIVGTDAGETFGKLADVHVKLESKHDAANCWVEAAKAYLKVDHRREKGAGPGLIHGSAFLFVYEA